MMILLQAMIGYGMFSLFALFAVAVLIAGIVAFFIEKRKPTIGEIFIAGMLIAVITFWLKLTVSMETTTNLIN